MQDSYLIDGHKLLWHLDRVHKWQQGELIAPIYVEISPTSSCNHRCVFCGIDFAQGSKEFIDTSALCNAIKKMGQIGVKSIMFAGEGEPMLHKSLPDFVKVAKNHGIDVSITTNGSLANYEKAKDLLPHLTWIRFSLDAGTPETYAKTHGVSKDIFDKVVANIEDCLKIKKDNRLGVTIGIQYLVINQDIDDIRSAIKLATRLQVDYLAFKPFSLHPQMLSRTDVNYEEGFLNAIEDSIEECNGRQPTRIIFRSDSFRTYLQRQIKNNHCYALPFWGYISSRGDFYSCSVHLNNERFFCGNIYDKDIEEIIFGTMRKASVEYAQKSLDIKSHCRINCRMARINEFLEQLSNPPEHINFI